MPTKTRSTDDDLDFSPDQLATPTASKGKKKVSSHGKGKSTKRSASPKKKTVKANSPISSLQANPVEPANVAVELDEPSNTPGPFNDFVISGPSTSSDQAQSLPEPSMTIPAPAPPISYVPTTQSNPTHGSFYLLFMSTPVSSLAHTRLPVEFGKSPTISIGRDAGNDVVIPDQVVSRNHAELSIQDGRIFLKDRGSSNGTFLYDGTDFQQVQDTVEVKPNSVIRFGTTTIVKLTRE